MALTTLIGSIHRDRSNFYFNLYGVAQKQQQQQIQKLQQQQQQIGQSLAYKMKHGLSFQL
jgi:hypothetical protein